MGTGSGKLLAILVGCCCTHCGLRHLSLYTPEKKLGHGKATFFARKPQHYKAIHDLKNLVGHPMRDMLQPNGVTSPNHDREGVTKYSSFCNTLVLPASCTNSAPSLLPNKGRHQSAVRGACSAKRFGLEGNWGGPVKWPETRNLQHVFKESAAMDFIFSSGNQEAGSD